MIDEKGKRHSTPEAGIPPHMLEEPLNEPQRKAFAKAKREEEAPAKKSGARKGTKRRKKAAADSVAAEENAGTE